MKSGVIIRADNAQAIMNTLLLSSNLEKFEGEYAKCSLFQWTKE